jgi:uncharacterized Zn finger protein
MIEDRRKLEKNENDFTSITCDNCSEEITVEYIPDENKSQTAICSECGFPFEFPGEIKSVEIY